MIMLFCSVFTVIVFYSPWDLQLGATNAYSVESLSLLHHFFAFRDLLFTVVIH